VSSLLRLPDFSAGETVEDGISDCRLTEHR